MRLARTLTVLDRSRPTRLSSILRNRATAMTWDDSETEYHLTPRGWEVGDAPVDLVETWLRTVYRQSPCPDEYVSWVCKWADLNTARVANFARSVENSWAAEINPAIASQLSAIRCWGNSGMLKGPRGESVPPT